jgi:hypothetical protein
LTAAAVAELVALPTTPRPADHDALAVEVEWEAVRAHQRGIAVHMTGEWHSGDIAFT